MKFDDCYAMTIDGQAIPGAKTFEVVNPANEAPIARASDADRSQLDAAVAAARAAFPIWAATPSDEHGAAIDRLGNAVVANIDGFKRLLTSEQGKPHGEAEMEVGGAGMWLKGAASSSFR